VTIDRDDTIRAALLPRLSSIVSLEADCVLIEELGIEHGSSRIDIAAIGSLVHGFEIKAGLDSLTRLQHQVTHYDKLVDLAYLVVAENHLESATLILPDHWGLIVAESAPEGIEFRVERFARRNLNRVPESLARLLWRDEALATLISLGLDRGFRRKPARALHSRLAATVDLDVLSALVLERIRRRDNWGERQKRPMQLSAVTQA
jgi:hypothetical protein